MNKRQVKTFAALLVLAVAGAIIAAARYDGPEDNGRDSILRQQHDRQTAIHLNEAAASIRTEADARIEEQPVRLGEMNYLQQHRQESLNRLVVPLFDRLFPPHEYH